MSLSTETRQHVRRRAQDRCEYCHSRQEHVFDTLEMDHIIPQAKEGSDHDNNLCLACRMCNRAKGTQTDALDPLTAERVPLFNPRSQDWLEHFQWSNNGFEIIGLTSCGRATVAALKLNNPLAIRVRRNWVEAGWHPAKA